MSRLSVHSAAQNSNVSVPELRLMKSSTNLRGHADQLPLLRTLLAEDPKLVDSVDVDARTPLHWAASSGSIEIARFLIDQKAEVNKTDNSVSAGHENVVQELIGAGADVNRHYAASKSRIDIGRLLISRGADDWWVILCKSADKLWFLKYTFYSFLLGNTPLHLAMDSAHAEAAVVLINAGADRTRENLDGETPEAVAGVEGQEQKLARQYVIDHCGKA
ncbi:ankyrin repeat-containing domain protein [Gymnopilus junonius]|uniref:Ankyrin repeat-containing domain protein n=1 Tax=Gymnopilus junonius TaxID=109634 RepID=A0A9P5NSE1_GYMJU|nr:ankyrin repeat-containing domain protein [Gymnopilus junonius]